jgi:hypothetical protein
MNITVNVDEVTLDSLIRDGSEYGNGCTIGDQVAFLALQRLTSETEGWYSIRERVQRVTDEEIREHVRPLITEALTRPFRQTNSFGEPVGGETTLSSVIVDEARKAFKVRADNYGSSQTVLQKLVAEEVQQAFKTVIADEVKQARALVADQIGEQVAAAVKAGMKAR